MLTLSKTEGFTVHSLIQSPKHPPEVEALLGINEMPREW